MAQAVRAIYEHGQLRLLDPVKLAEGQEVHLTIAAGQDKTDVPGIERIPGVIGGDPIIVRTRIPVWLIIQAGRLGSTDEELLQNYPSLRAQDLYNARTYYELNKGEIDQQIEENENA